MYMTSQQWDRMTHWSAPLVVQHAEGVEKDGPWLLLEHEINKIKEYTDVVNEHHERLHRALELGIITRG